MVRDFLTREVIKMKKRVVVNSNNISKLSVNYVGSGLNVVDLIMSGKVCDLGCVRVFLVVVVNRNAS